MTKKYQLRQFGFGLLEALIASGMIAVFTAGIVILGNLSIRSVVVNKHKLQAAYLAQEAIEAVRNIRDSNWVDENINTNWDNGFPASAGVYTNRGVRLSSNLWTINNSPDYFDSNLNQNNIPDYNSNERIFARAIKITRNSVSGNTLADKIIDIEVEVSWQDYGKSRSVKIDSSLTDWQQY